MAIPDDPTPLQVFVAATGIGAVAGMTAALRSSAALVGRYVGSSILTGGLSALLTALVCHNYARDSSSIYLLLGISGIAGYGGPVVLDAMLAVLVKFIGQKGNQIADNYTPRRRREEPSDEVNKQ